MSKFKRLREALIKQGITVAYDGINIGERVTAFASFKNGSYYIGIPYEYVENDDIAYGLLSHEIHHITRGDIKLLLSEGKKLEGKTKEQQKQILKDLIDPQLWNIASDAHINTKTIVELLKNIKGGIVEYDKLREQYDELPKYIPSTKTIYEILKKAKEEQNEQLQKMINEMVDQIGNSTTNNSQTDSDQSGEVPSDAEHAEQMVKIRKAANEANDKSVGKMASDSINKKRTSIQSSGVDAKKVASIDKLLKMVRGFNKDRRFSRTWNYPSFISKNTRGAIYQPRAHCVIIIDTSGSMDKYKSTMFGISKSLANTHDLTFILHHTEAYCVSNKLTNQWESGGTSFVPAFSEAAKLNAKPDIIVHLTDNESYDIEKAYDKVQCPIITCEVPDFEPKFVK